MRRQRWTDGQVYDETTGEWVASGVEAFGEAAIKVRDAVGNLLAGGEKVTLTKDLAVMGAGQLSSAARSSNQFDSLAIGKKSTVETAA